MKKIQSSVQFWILATTIYSLITIIIFYSRVSTLTTHYGMPDVDTDGGMWYQWLRVYTSQNDLLYYITTKIAYPFGFDLTFLPFSNLTYSIQIFLLEHIFGFNWKNLVIITNISSLITYPLSGLSAGLLAFFLTKNRWASFLAGLIFSFSFYHVFMARAQLSINHIELIPMYFLTLFYYLNKKNVKSVIYSSLAMAILFNTDPYYAFFSGILSVVIFFLYKQESVVEKLKSFIIYFLTLGIVTVLINFNYFYSNLYLFNQAQAVATGRNSYPKNELLNILFFFIPPHESLLNQYIPLLGGFISIITPFTAFFGLLFIKKNRLYLTLIATTLISIVLSAYIPLLYWINEIYFRYFGIFRGVSRMSLLTYLFIGLLVAIVFDSLSKQKEFKNIKYINKIIILMFFSLAVIGSSLSNDITWIRKTDFSKIATLYKPIEENKDIKVIANYPMTIGDNITGCPQTFTELAQIIHNKSYACGASPFSKSSQAYYKSISDINDPTTIATLEKYNVDTILINNKLIKNSGVINKKLLSDSRIKFIGRYSSSIDEGYLSVQDLSRDYSLYQIKNVVEENKKPNLMFYLKNNMTSIQYTKVSPEKYIINLSKITLPTEIIYDAPYSEKWKIYSGNLTTENNFSFLFNKPLNLSHKTYNKYANQWLIEEDKLNKNENYYKKNDDGTYNLSLTVYFQPQSIITLLNLISKSTLVVLLGYLILKFIYDKSKK